MKDLALLMPKQFCWLIRIFEESFVKGYPNRQFQLFLIFHGNNPVYQMGVSMLTQYQDRLPRAWLRYLQHDLRFELIRLGDYRVGEQYFYRFQRCDAQNE